MSYLCGQILGGFIRAGLESSDLEEYVLDEFE